MFFVELFFVKKSRLSVERVRSNYTTTRVSRTITQKTKHKKHLVLQLTVGQNPARDITYIGEAVGLQVLLGIAAAGT